MVQLETNVKSVSSSDSSMNNNEENATFEREDESFLPLSLISNKIPTIIIPRDTNNINKCTEELIPLQNPCKFDIEKPSDQVYAPTTTTNGVLPVQNINKIKKVRTGWMRYLGILLALFSSMIFPLAGLIVKALPQYHPFSVTFWRFQGVLWPAIPMAVYYRCAKNEPIFDTVLPLSAPGRCRTIAFLILRMATGASSVTCMFYSLQFISVADSTVISFSAPVFVTLAAHIFLGEKCGIVPIISGLFALTGVAIITRPPILTGAKEFDNDNLIGTALACGCMVLATTTIVVLRYLRQLHYTLLNLCFGFWGSGQALLMSMIVLTFQLPQGIEHWLLAIGLAIITGVAQSCMTLSLKFEQAGTVSLCRSCDVVFAFIWQFIILGAVPDRFSVIGASVVIIGIILIGFRKWISELPVDDNTRKRFNYLLK